MANNKLLGVPLQPKKQERVVCDIVFNETVSPNIIDTSYNTEEYKPNEHLVDKFVTPSEINSFLSVADFLKFSLSVKEDPEDPDFLVLKSSEEDFVSPHNEVCLIEDEEDSLKTIIESRTNSLYNTYIGNPGLIDEDPTILITSSVLNFKTSTGDEFDLVDSDTYTDAVDLRPVIKYIEGIGKSYSGEVKVSCNESSFGIYCTAGVWDDYDTINENYESGTGSHLPFFYTVDDNIFRVSGLHGAKECYIQECKITIQ